MGGFLSLDTKKQPIQQTIQVMMKKSQLQKIMTLKKIKKPKMQRRTPVTKKKKANIVPAFVLRNFSKSLERKRSMFYLLSTLAVVASTFATLTKTDSTITPVCLSISFFTFS